jgi:hypothetical protein
MSLLREVSRFVASDPWGITGHARVLPSAGKLNNPKMFDELRQLSQPRLSGGTILGQGEKLVTVADSVRLAIPTADQMATHPHDTRLWRFGLEEGEDALSSRRSQRSFFDVGHENAPKPNKSPTLPRQSRPFEMTKQF